MWTGGGQEIKGRTFFSRFSKDYLLTFASANEDWTFDTMKAAALKFPQLVSKTPMRTHAILTKYTALRSFFTTNAQVSLPMFEKARVYTSLLQEAFFDYKTIAKNLQVLAYDVSTGSQVLQDAPGKKESKSGGSTEDSEKTSDSEGEGTVKITHKNAPTPTVGNALATLILTKPFPSTIQGLEAAKQSVRYMMNRIVQEVDVVSRTPEVATDENRPLPYMSPFSFKELLPVSPFSHIRFHIFFTNLP
jgi:hypothetical protein